MNKIAVGFFGFVMGCFLTAGVMQVVAAPQVQVDPRGSVRARAVALDKVRKIKDRLNPADIKTKQNVPELREAVADLSETVQILWELAEPNIAAR